ncbi:hypothetical protein [Dyella flagellata]|uniref:Uncharacterized protein n=1 Tax=Dyella flagellata TaxID=1867833 RepID=A0ABQ5XFT7_9GAMM|nr:hypothetical protein [Dyella flagellata]GLQ89807.1 hypothetical protein GCM10007898_33820 [Dyella flagellata]
MRSLAAANSALSIADRHIAEARLSINHQAYRVNQWKEWGCDATLPEELLHLMQDALDAFLVHRGLIIDEIKQHQVWCWLKEEAPICAAEKPRA